MPIQTRSNPHKSASMETGASLSDQRLLSDRPSQAFKVYRCRWLGCKAELHNFDNLKRHLKLHKKVDESNDGVPCDWAGCECSPCASPYETLAGVKKTPGHGVFSRRVTCLIHPRYTPSFQRRV
jgi:hypothetical protein